jgi:hypothetical protein
MRRGGREIEQELQGKRNLASRRSTRKQTGDPCRDPSSIGGQMSTDYDRLAAKTPNPPAVYRLEYPRGVILEVRSGFPAGELGALSITADWTFWPRGRLARRRGYDGRGAIAGEAAGI